MTEQRFAERRRADTWHRIRRWLIVAVVVIAAGALVWLVWFSTVLGVRHVQVDGLETLKPAAVTNKAAVQTGRPLARLDVASIEARVASLERVESVQVKRHWPTTVKIEVTERHAVAWIQTGGTIRGLDRFGVDFRDYAKAPKGLIEVRVSTFDSAKRQDALVEAAKVLGLIRADDPGLDASIEHVNVASKDSVELVLSKNRTVRWGSAARSSEKIAVLGPLLKIKARAYDVAAPERPTTKE